MKKLISHDKEVMKLVMDSLFSRGLTSEMINTNLWNMEYARVHALLQIETMEWMAHNMTVKQ